MYAASVIADSIANGHRLVSLEVTMPRLILAEFNTHRALRAVSGNAASSRAIPIDTMIDQVETNPFVPDRFTKNQKGMQASEELDEEGQVAAREMWLQGARDAVDHVRRLSSIGVHKQQANRLLEPYLWTTAIVTATEWSNFFSLRTDKAAQPEMQRTATLMLRAYEESTPVARCWADGVGTWHLPYIVEEDWDVARVALRDETGRSLACDIQDRLVKVSVGRCAAVSYLRQREQRGHQQEMALYERLLAGPHLSPLEHVARPMDKHEYSFNRQNEAVWQEDKGTWLLTGKQTHFLGNVQGWIQKRKTIRNEQDFSLCRRPS